MKKIGLGTNQSTGFLISVPTNYGFYFRAYKGVSYNLVNNSPTVSYVVCRLSDIPDVGVSFSDRVVVYPSQSLKLELSNDTNLYIYCLQTSLVPDITVTSDIDNYMLFSMDRLGDITFSGLWDTFNKCIPYILVVVLVAFGIYLITHAIREISKGRDV